MITVRACVEVIKRLEVNGAKASGWIPPFRRVKSIGTTGRSRTRSAKVASADDVIREQLIVLVERWVDPAKSAFATIQASIVN